jgi:hypothetical protein
VCGKRRSVVTVLERIGGEVRTGESVGEKRQEE